MGREARTRSAADGRGGPPWIRRRPARLRWSTARCGTRVPIPGKTAFHVFAGSAGIPRKRRARQAGAEIRIAVGSADPGAPIHLVRGTREIERSTPAQDHVAIAHFRGDVHHQHRGRLIFVPYPQAVVSAGGDGYKPRVRRGDVALPESVVAPARDRAVGLECEHMTIPPISASVPPAAMAMNPALGCGTWHWP